jgi:hypothetical protein
MNNDNGQLQCCPICSDQKFYYVKVIFDDKIILGAKNCSCLVPSHTEIDVYNSMFNNGDQKLLRFPIEKTSIKTGLAISDAKVLEFK